MPKFKVVTGILDRYAKPCRDALAVCLQHSVDYDSCYMPIWVEERPAVMVLDAEDDTKCYGVIQWNPSLEAYGYLYVNWAHSTHPQAFLLLAMAVRKAAKEMKAKGISFAVLAGNTRMQALAAKMGARPTSTNYVIRGA